MGFRSKKLQQFGEEEGVFLRHATLMAMIRNSIGSRFFQELYFDQGEKAIDVLEHGNLSCAVYVSFILHNLGLLKEPHTFVTHTVADLKQSGWAQIPEPRPGAILLWGPWELSAHRHIGFYIGDDQAVSNVDIQESPQAHHWTYGEKENGAPARAVVAIYWHSLLDDQK